MINPLGVKPFVKGGRMKWVFKFEITSETKCIVLDKETGGFP